MQKYGSFIWVVIAAVLFSGCITAQYRKEARRVQSSNPHFALEYASKAVQNAPDDQESKDMTRSILGSVATEHRARIAEMRVSEAYEDAVADCDRVVASAHFVKGFSGRFNLPYDEGERKELAELAAEKCYKEALDCESKKLSREAVDAFCRCVGFRTNYKDSVKRMADLKDKATTRLFLFAKPDNGDQEQLCKQLLTGVSHGAMLDRPRFLKIVQSVDEATSKGELTIQAVNLADTGWMARANEAHYYENKTDEKGNVVKVIDHYAQWILHEREISCTVTAGYSITPIREGDQPGTGSDTKTSNWSQKYIRINGDMRAVPADLAQLPQNAPLPPSRQALASACIRLINYRLSVQIFSQYK